MSNKTESNKKIIAYCGLYCGDCFNRQGKIADLARDLRKELRKYNFSEVSKGLAKYFKDLKNYDVCYQTLRAMVRLRCNHCCVEGGGNPMCKIRKCCQKNKIKGCWQCNNFEKCNKFAFLKSIHKDANIKNLRRIKKEGIDKLIKGSRDW